MLRIVLQKAAIAFATLFGLTVFLFFWSAPFSERNFQVLVDHNSQVTSPMSDDELRRFARRIGYDRSVVVQYGIWLGNTLDVFFPSNRETALQINQRAEVLLKQQRPRPGTR